MALSIRHTNNLTGIYNAVVVNIQKNGCTNNSTVNRGCSASHENHAVGLVFSSIIESTTITKSQLEDIGRRAIGINNSDRVIISTSYSSSRRN